jgi:hypothetical protein
MITKGHKRGSFASCMKATAHTSERVPLRQLNFPLRTTTPLRPTFNLRFYLTSMGRQVRHEPRQVDSGRDTHPSPDAHPLSLIPRISPELLTYTMYFQRPGACRGINFAGNAWTPFLHIPSENRPTPCALFGSQTRTLLFQLFTSHIATASKR